MVIGKNDLWKQSINLGNRTNQNFVCIPHARFIEMLTYKCQLVGISVVITSENYTSKCSFIDFEPIEKREVYLGKRVKRGLFRSSNGFLINADCNASGNILKKVVPAGLFGSDKGEPLRCGGSPRCSKWRGCSSPGENYSSQISFIVDVIFDYKIYNYNFLITI
ncbi:MAG: zinc ribbon domain-containing protein [Nostocales cyanobacterium 94392]|nr:zinc ribbon domain-containing protein [Nostocales cyanobacterium 94392]